LSEETNKETKAFTTGRRKYARQEDVEKILESNAQLIALVKKQDELIKEQDNRIKGLEESLSSIAEALVKISGSQEGAKAESPGIGKGIGQLIVSKLVSEAMGGSPLEKLMHRSLVESIMFDRTLRYAFLSSMGKRFARRYAKSVKQFFEEEETEGLDE